MDGALLRFYGATFSYAVSMGIGYPMVSEYLDVEFHATDLLIGVVLGVYGLMQIFLRLPMGDMADRRGRRRSLLLAFLFTFIAGAFFTFAASAIWVVPAVAAFGFAGGIFWVAANSYLYDRVAALDGAADAGAGDAVGGDGGGLVDGAGVGRKSGRTERATSDYSLAVALAFLVGPVVGHQLAEHYGFRAAYATFLVVSVIGAALVLTLPEAPRAPRPKPTTSPYRRALGLIRDRPVLALSAIGTLLYSTLFATMNAFFQLHALAAGLALGTIGFLLSGRQLAGVLVRLGLPAMLKRFGPLHVLYAGIVLAGVSSLAVPLAGDVVSLAVVVSGFGAAIGLMIPANLMLVNEGAPPEARGLANGIYGTMLGVGSAAAPWIFGFLAEAMGRAWAFRGAGILALVGLLALVIVSRSPRARRRLDAA